MLAVDTNVVVRLLVGDDARQLGQARQLLETNDIWISVTVLLETAWVLTTVYEIDEAEAVDAIRRLLGLPNVRVEDPANVAAAMDASAAVGLELADAMHLYRVPDGAGFATFDRALARCGGKLKSVLLLE